MRLAWRWSILKQTDRDAHLGELYPSGFVDTPTDMHTACPFFMRITQLHLIETALLICYHIYCIYMLPKGNRMYLKRIEINGFKSFANKTEIILGSKITGVVGPNGSGKSNISDAIRWVLGEQSSKNLRGSKMEDVIFNGTATRGRKAYAEVSLVFDNSDGRMSIDYSEITVTRKMYRSGESEYYINRNPVRLRDIVDLMRDTGIGKEGYSIVGQGKIDEILENRPAARRRVIEEAAGIMKFRARKEEAEHKLQKTEENVSRIDDILSELNGQLEPLKKQAEQAREYQRIFERQKVVDANLFLYNFDRLNSRIDKITEELKDAEAEIEELKEKTGGSAEEDARLSGRLDELNAEKNALSEKLTELSKESERHAGTAALLEERKANIIADTKRAEEDRQEKRASLEKFSAMLSETEQKRSNAEQETAALEEAYREIAEEIAELQAGLEDRRNSFFKEKGRFELIISDINEGKTELSAIDAKIEAAEQKQKDILSRIDSLQKDAAERNLLVIEEKRLLNRTQDEIGSAAVELNEKKFRINKAKSERASLEAQAEAAKNSLARARSEKQLLLDMKAEYDGYSESVRNLMKAAGGERQIRSLIRGTFAELIKVPDRYETAIETVLGNVLQNVVVDTEEDAKQIIDFLHKKNLGRVTFMPLNALKVNRLDRQERSALNDSGFLAVASEVLEFDEAIRPAVEFALARTVLVEDMDAAIRVMRKGDYAFRAVTLKGDFIRPGGVMTGGSAGGKARFGLLSREHRLKDADERIKLAQTEADKKDGLLKLMDDELSVLDSASQALLAELSKLEVSAAERRERISAQTDTIDSAADSEMELNSEYSAIAEQIEELKRRRTEFEGMQQELSARADEAKRMEEDFSRSEGDRLKKKEELNEKLHELKIRGAELKKELEAINENANRINSERALAEFAKEKTEDKLRELALKAEETDKEKKHSMLAKEAVDNNLSEVRSAFEKKESERKELNDRVQRMRQNTSEAQQRQTELFERKFKLDAQLEKTSMLRENSQQKLWEDYELTYALARELKTEINYTAASQESGELRSRIRELGPINPNAIEDCERVSSRADDLTEQKEDLLNAKTDLETVISSLLSAMRDTFEERFELLNTHFKRIFTDLFGGGRAELIMGEGDILDAGIDITAEPPGKKLQQLSLLSGGERALTAIALLFAMISINPSPVCLFDEIDAPLDEANARLFSEYLRRIEKTQFVIITHRKPTMALCDSLYGVAMQEKGVSTLVSVNLK